MCGIIGFLSTKHKQSPNKNSALGNTLDGLKSLEYRGYDSAGIAFPTRTGFTVIRSVGNVDKLITKVGNETHDAPLAIGHTRWATHGRVSEINAHPHVSSDGRVAVVHNGIISNYQEIRTILAQKGIEMKSQTDTEVIPNLISLFLPDENNAQNKRKTSQTELLHAVKRAVGHLHGSYAFLAISNDSETIVATRKGRQPLTLGSAKDFYYITSDIPTAKEKCKTIYALEENEFLQVNKQGFTFYKDDRVIKKNPLTNIKRTPKPDKGTFPTFMEKEIFEIPKVISRIGINYGKIAKTTSFQEAVTALRTSQTVHIAACGTAYHAGLVIGQMIESKLKKRTKIYIASEMPYQSPLVGKNDIGIIISQSGETADTLSALQLMKEHGLPTIGICNVEGSSISRYVDWFLPTLAGTEVAVASTKAYIAQVTIGSILVKNAEASTFATLPHVAMKNYAQNLLEVAPEIKAMARKYRDIKRIFFLGKGVGAISALEAALKVKEITYKHCEGWPAGELKHGTLSLVDQDTLTIIFANCSMRDMPPQYMASMREKLSNAEAEVKARGSKTWVINGGRANDDVFPVLDVMLAQLFALYLAEELKLNPDQPRNLAKSVTVH